MTASRTAHTGRRAGIAVGLVAAALTLLAPAAAQAAISAEQVVPQAFNNPVYVAQPPTSSRLFVVEQPGSIRLIKDGIKLSTPFLNIEDRVGYDGGERGLFSIAFPPNYGTGAGSTTRRFYVYFTNNDGDLRITEFKRKKSTGDLASTTYSRTLLKIPHSGEDNHNGGQLQFGPDGFLYAATGDGGSGNDPPNNAQDKNVLLGKLLRIDRHPSGSQPYTNPPGNPFAGSTPGQGEIYSMGLRNPFRFSFDGETLTIGDVGQGRVEEVDILSRSAANGANFGWSGYEGPELNDAVSGEPDRVPASPTAPVFYYCHPSITTPPPHCGGGEATGTVITGGYIVRDESLGLTGRYLYADFGVGQLRSFLPSDPFGTDAAVGVSISGPSSFGVDNANHLYVTSLFDDHVYMLVNTP